MQLVSLATGCDARAGAGRAPTLLDRLRRRLRARSAAIALAAVALLARRRADVAVADPADRLSASGGPTRSARSTRARSPARSLPTWWPGPATGSRCSCSRSARCAASTSRGPIATGAFAASYVVGYLTLFLPAGLGVREGVMILLLTRFHRDRPGGRRLPPPPAITLTVNEVGAALPFLLFRRKLRDISIASLTRSFEPRFPVLIAAAGVRASRRCRSCTRCSPARSSADRTRSTSATRCAPSPPQGCSTRGHIPQWNPFIFGGMPLWAVPGHFDVFYPTAWLRWFLSADHALTLGFFIHFVVAGMAMYALLRTLRASWTACRRRRPRVRTHRDPRVAGEPGPRRQALRCGARAVRVRRAAARDPAWQDRQLRMVRAGHRARDADAALSRGVLPAGRLRALHALARLPRSRTPSRSRRQYSRSRMAALAVALGLGIAAIELLPVQHMVAYTARGPGGASLGYDYATSWAMPPEELMTAILPQFNGMLPVHYWGPNFFKDHTEYLGAIVVTLMILGIPAARKRRLLLPFGGLGVLFLLVAWGGYSPFYHLWYLLPKMGQFRAPGPRILHGGAGHLRLRRAWVSISCSRAKQDAGRCSRRWECSAASPSWPRPGCCRASPSRLPIRGCWRRRRATPRRCRLAAFDCSSSCWSAVRCCS